MLLTALDSASMTSHIHSWVLFVLWLHLFILSGVISPLSLVAYWAPTDLGVHLSVSYLFAFHTFYGAQGKNIEVVCHSCLQ